MIKSDSQKEIRVLELAVENIKTFGDRFVAYNTEFLGISNDDNFKINGKSTKDAESLDEICFGYDMDDQLQLLEVYETFGVKFASTELMMGVYGFWRVSEPKKRKKKKFLFK